MAKEIGTQSNTPLDHTSNAAGLFQPNGMLRQVLGESVGLLGGGCDLLLQIAHPLVAAGVLDHSRFQADPLARLRATIDSLLGIVFGEHEQAKSTLHDFHSKHTPVRGELREQAGRYPAGTSYSGHDPELKLWVHASLIWTQLRLYELFVRRLSAAEREQFHEESKLLAWRLGIPRSLLPPTLADFEAYVAAMLASDALAVTPATLALSRAVLKPANVWLVARILIKPSGLITAGLLPARLRRDYALRWDRKRQRTFNVICWLSRHIVPLTPTPLRLLPRARAGRLFRWAFGEGVQKTG